MKLPTFIITPYAVEAQAPVFVPFPQPTDLIIVLLWGIELRLPGLPPENLGVILTKTPSPDHTRQRYTPVLQSSASKRLFSLPCDREPWSGPLGTPRNRLEWKTIYIAHAPPTTQPLGLHLLTRSVHSPFHIPRSHIMELLRSPSVTSSALLGSNVDSKDDHKLKGTMTLTFTIQAPGSDVQFNIFIHLGLCSRASESNPKHWARAKRHHGRGTGGARSAAGEEPEHDCAKHHVDEWKKGNRTFTIGPGPSDALQQLSIKLSFEPYVLDPVWVRRVHVSFNVHRSAPLAEPPKVDVEEPDGGGKCS